MKAPEGKRLEGVVASATEDVPLLGFCSKKDLSACMELSSSPLPSFSVLEDSLLMLLLFSFLFFPFALLDDCVVFVPFFAVRFDSVFAAVDDDESVFCDTDDDDDDDPKREEVDAGVAVCPPLLYLTS